MLSGDLMLGLYAKVFVYTYTARDATCKNTFTTAIPSGGLAREPGTYIAWHCPESLLRTMLSEAVGPFCSFAVQAKYQKAVMVSSLVTFIGAYYYVRIFDSWVDACDFSIGSTDASVHGDRRGRGLPVWAASGGTAATRRWPPRRWREARYGLRGVRVGEASHPGPAGRLSTQGSDREREHERDRARARILTTVQ